MNCPDKSLQLVGHAGIWSCNELPHIHQVYFYPSLVDGPHKKCSWVCYCLWANGLGPLAQAIVVHAFKLRDLGFSPHRWTDHGCYYRNNIGPINSDRNLENHALFLERTAGYFRLPVESQLLCINFIISVLNLNFLLNYLGAFKSNVALWLLSSWEHWRILSKLSFSIWKIEQVPLPLFGDNDR